MEPGLVLATLMNLEVQIEHVLDVGFAMLEDEPSLFHAQNAGTGAKRLHRCDDVTLPLDVNEDQGSNLVNRESHATGVVRDVHVVDKMGRKCSRSNLMTVSSLLRDLEMTATRATKPLLDGHLGLANVDLLTMPTCNPVDGAVMVAFAPIQALTVLSGTINCPAIAISIGEIRRADAAHHLPPQIRRKDRLKVGKGVVCHPDP